MLLGIYPLNNWFASKKIPFSRCFWKLYSFDQTTVLRTSFPVKGAPKNPWAPLPGIFGTDPKLVTRRHLKRWPAPGIFVGVATGKIFQVKAGKKKWNTKKKSSSKSVFFILEFFQKNVSFLFWWTSLDTWNKNNACHNKLQLDKRHWKSIGLCLYESCTTLLTDLFWGLCLVCWARRCFVGTIDMSCIQTWVSGKRYRDTVHLWSKWTCR